MNIIRSKAVELSAIPAIAYKYKLKSGGSGIKILRLDVDTFAVATIDKRTGEPIALGKIDESLFPYEAFDEAFELTSGLPYSARGKIVINVFNVSADETEIEAEDEAKDEVCMLNSPEYQAIIERYADEKGKLNYQLMNKDFIQFSSKSKVVSTMIGEGANTDDVVLFIIKNRAAWLINDKEHLPDKQALKLVEALDEIDPRSAFKELKAHIRRQQSKRGI